jgi:hypothetical protein
VPNPPPVKPVVDVVTVNVTERGPWAAGRHQFVRADPVLHHTLRQPAMRSPRPEPPAPLPPGEDYLRGQLRVATKSAGQADKDFRNAEAACTRADDHLKKSQSHAASFSGLDDEMDAATVDALRSGTDMGTVQESFAERVAERTAAQAELVRVQSAANKLAAERDVARQRAETATAGANRLAAHVLAFTAEIIAGEIHALKAEVARRRKALLGYDRVATGFGLGLSLTVRQAIGEVSTQDVLQADPMPWKDAAQTLKADPDADIEIELPPLPARPIPVQKFEPVPAEAPDVTEEPPPPENDRR